MVGVGGEAEEQSQKTKRVAKTGKNSDVLLLLIRLPTSMYSLVEEPCQTLSSPID